VILAAISLLAQGAADDEYSFGARIERTANAEELVGAFVEVCLKTADVPSARKAASELPDATRVHQEKLPANYRVFQRPSMSVGIWGSEVATCFVTAKAETAETPEKMVVLLSDVRGKPLKVRKRGTGFRYVIWKQAEMTVTFEYGLKETGLYDLMIVANNKGR
jgi:hypothetical protein